MFTTEEEYKKGRCGNYMKVWYCDGFQVEDRIERYSDFFWDKHIVWTGQYA